jgi:hypothetical protein
MMSTMAVMDTSFGKGGSRGCAASTVSHLGGKGCVAGDVG